MLEWGSYADISTGDNNLDSILDIEMRTSLSRNSSWDGGYSRDADFFLYMFPLLHTGKHTVQVSSNSISRTQSIYFPTRETPLSNHKTIQIFYTNNDNYRSICEGMIDRSYEDLRHISIGLPLMRNHSARVYQMTPNDIYIMTNKVPTVAFVRKIAAVIPILFPEVIKETTLPPELFQKIAGSKEEWLVVFKKWLEDNNVVQKLEEQKLKRMLEQMLQNEKNQHNHRINILDDEIRRLQENIKSCYKDRRVARLKLLNIEQAGADAAKEFLDFVYKSQDILDIGFDDNYLNLTISTPVNSDTSILEIMLDSPRELCEPKLRKVLREIFLENKYTMFFKQTVAVDLLNSSVHRANPVPSVMRKYFGLLNPHLEAFNCWGTGYHLIEEALIEKDYIKAATQIMHSVGNIAWDDSTVVRHFLDSLEGNDDAESSETPHMMKTLCLIDNSTGDKLSIGEAIERMQKNETN